MSIRLNIKRLAFEGGVKLGPLRLVSRARLSADVMR